MAQDCKVCLTQHDEEIHAATNRVYAWFRGEVTRHLVDAADYPTLNEVEKNAAPQLSAA
jgi:hypothetical protein